MDPALKQRMLGAAVLIVLAIIFVPMLLDGSPSTRSETVDLSIPDAPDRDFETRVVPLDRDSPATSATAQPDPNRVATVDAQAPARVDALADDPATAPARATPEPAPAATPAPVPVATPAPMPAARGRYVLSFGSYGQRANAVKLVQELKRAKIAAYSDEVSANGRAMTRVRSGPYVDRTDAEAARLLAKRARPDVNGTIVEVDDTPATDVPAAAVGAAVTGWAVQVGAYQSEAEAGAQRDKLRGAGFAAFVDPVRGANGTMYRVRVGPEAVRANAEKLRDSLKARFRVDGLVVTHP